MCVLLLWSVLPALTRWLRAKQGEGQPIQSDGPETHLKKKGTPTMGGLMILFGVLVAEERSGEGDFDISRAFVNLDPRRIAVFLLAVVLIGCCIRLCVCISQRNVLILAAARASRQGQ